MSGWHPEALAVAYDDDLLAWQLGDGHPTNPLRAKLCVERLDELRCPWSSLRSAGG